MPHRSDSGVAAFNRLQQQLLVYSWHYRGSSGRRRSPPSPCNALPEAPVPPAVAASAMWSREGLYNILLRVSPGLPLSPKVKNCEGEW